MAAGDEVGKMRVVGNGRVRKRFFALLFNVI